jgi:tRNA-modifying protein YgfZ
LVMERVKIAPLTGIFTTFLGGSGAEAALAEFSLLPAPGEGSNCTQNIHGAIVTAVRVHWIGDEGFLIYTTAEALPMLYAAGEPLAADIFEALRIEAGVPRGRLDFDEKTLAPETGQSARAIHYKKGCYIGQEIVARLDARGHTNRSLVRLTCDQLFPPRTPILVEGSEVGWLTSCALGPTEEKPVALGYLRNAAAVLGTKVQIGESGVGVVR